MIREQNEEEILKLDRWNLTRSAGRQNIDWRAANAQPPPQTPAVSPHIPPHISGQCGIAISRMMNRGARSVEKN